MSWGRHPWVVSLREGLFLASSWTWCIGMFLPVLLVRDFGVKGWWIFALPNCMGAALMGVVLRGVQSREYREAHGIAIRAFSLVTLAFQIFFAAWLMMAWGLSTVGVAGIVLFLLFAMGMRSGMSVKALWVWVLGAFVGSCALGAYWLLTDKSRASLSDLPSPVLDALHSGPLAAVCALGFLLCPYLDATFHSSLQRARAAAPVAFAIGFLVFFPLMILLTLFYAPGIIKQANDTGFAIAPVMAAAPVALHIFLQLGFTVGAHESELEHGPDWDKFASFLVGIALAVIAFRWQPPASLHMAGTEVVYRAFMGFYGLVAPAYVLVCALPGGRIARPTRLRWLLVLGAIAAASVFYYSGFLERDTPKLWIGVAIVLLAGFIGRLTDTRGGQTPPDHEGKPAPPDHGPVVLTARAEPPREGEPVSP